jgi:sugar transferase (PEP-CTERM/EpsH1 system associated)
MKILFLSTWFPFPPNQGSKTRALHLLKALAARHEVGLVSFEDIPLRPEWRAEIEKLCPIVEVVEERPFARPRLRATIGLLSLEPSAVRAGYSKEMSARVQAVARSWKPDVVVATTFLMAPYALALPGVRRVVDVDNLLALMLQEEVRQARGLLRRLRRLGAYSKLRRYESRIFRQFDLCLVTSSLDCRRIAGYVPLRPQQIGLVRNGVDLDYFAANGTSRAEDSLIFTGALTYEPNRDAMTYFIREILPVVRNARPAATLKITGAVGNQSLAASLGDGGVEFTGYLEDIRPALAGSAVAVVPLRKGAGTRLKILEAMALGTPVVSTTKGAEGLEVERGIHLLLADGPSEFAEATLQLLRDPGLRSRLAGRARQLVRATYDWASIGDDFAQMVQGLVESGRHG